MAVDVKEIFESFKLYGDYVSHAPYGSGHINDTFVVNVLQAGDPVRYLIQRINHNIFTQPEKLMDNIQRICDHLQKKLNEANDPDASRKSLTTIMTRDDKPFYVCPEGNYYRCYLFIEGALGYDIIENEDQAYQAARAFGDFQKLLVDIPGERLTETIPDFHNTPKRFEAFEAALAADKAGRAKDIEAEIQFLMDRKSDCSKLLDLNAQGLIPERITHNDTKLNNVLLDEKTAEATCVIDLDTSMPGLALYDFGDLVRTSTTPAAEDEKDLSKVDMQMNMFEALTKGYLSSAADFLTPSERENLVFGGKLMTFEVAIRFLTDYLDGDNYFKTHYEGHNLDRARTQIQLVKIIEEKQSEMEAFVQAEYERIKA